jgi:DNA-binding LacI/PurR family transcriptional regulator
MAAGFFLPPSKLNDIPDLSLMKKYEKVRDEIRSGLLNGTLQRGVAVPTERDMAAKLGVSRVTVRNAYVDLCNVGILTRSRGRGGTHVASNFQGHAKTSRLVAILTTLQDQFARSFVEAIQKQCLDHDFLAVLAVTPEDAEAQSKMALGMVTRGIGNMIVWGFSKDLDFQLFERLRIFGVNQVFFDRVKPQSEFADFVSIDNDHAVSSLMKHAVKSYKPNRIIGIDIADLKVDSSEERKNAMTYECRKHGIDLVWRHLKHRTTDDDKPIICSDQRKGDVFFTINDALAMRVRKCLFAANIISIDGTPEAIENNISSYHQPIDKLAEEAIGALLKQRKEGTAWRASHIKAKGELIKC